MVPLPPPSSCLSSKHGSLGTLPVQNSRCRAGDIHRRYYVACGFERKVLMRDTHSRPAQTCKACGGTWPCPGLAGWREPVNLPRFASWFSNVYFAFCFCCPCDTPVRSVTSHLSRVATGLQAFLETSSWTSCSAVCHATALVCPAHLRSAWSTSFNTSRAWE